MLQIFNCGIGFVLIVEKDVAQDVVDRLEGMKQKAWIIGEIVPMKPGSKEERVRIDLGLIGRRPPGSVFLSFGRLAFGWPGRIRMFPVLGRRRGASRQVRVEIAESETGAGLSEPFAEIEEAHGWPQVHPLCQVQVEVRVQIQIPELNEVHAQILHQARQRFPFRFRVADAGEEEVVQRETNSPAFLAIRMDSRTSENP